MAFINKQHHQSGFTLIEIVITIVVSSIMAVGLVSYIGDSVTGYISAGNRNQLASSGRTVLDRIAMELHNAVPNSVRVTAVNGGDQCMEFVPFLGATSYIDPPFTGQGADEFIVVGFNPAVVAGPAAGLFVFIYPIDTGAVYAAPTLLPGSPVPPDPGSVYQGSRAEIDSIAAADPDGKVLITLVNGHRFNRRSPVQRIYLTEQPVSFCVVGDRLYRYSNYGFAAVQPEPAGLPAQAPGRALISNQLTNAGLTAFSLQAPTLRRNGLVRMNFMFEELGDVINLNHEVQLRNVP